MNGFDESGLDEGAFGENKKSNIVKAFDAFPKTKPSYVTKTSSGGVWTVWVVLISIFLATSELKRWWVGTTTHTYGVEKGISHDLQINIDMVVAMRCEDIHINVQDASGDRILAGQALMKHPTTWAQWDKTKGVHALGGSAAERQQIDGEKSSYGEEDVHDYLGAAKKKRKFAKTPRLAKHAIPNSCRLFGSLDGNKVQGDFHITARGHGYMEFGAHLDHNTFNFSHIVNELSFGPFYPGLSNPLDNTRATTDAHFEKYQYYLSVVPTIYTTDAKSLARIKPAAVSPSSSDEANDKHPLGIWSRNTIFTNQYAVTEQSHPVGESQVPGIFVKFDIEPILLTIAEEWDGFLGLLVRLVNVVSGVLSAGAWCFQISEWAKEGLGKRRRRAMGEGVLHGRSHSLDEKKVPY